LAFKDNYLISGSADTTAKIWDIDRGFRLINTIRFHSKAVYGVKIIKNRGRYFAVTAGDDNKIALYDMTQKRVIKSDGANYNLDYLATNSKLKHIAVCGYGKEIKIYDYSLHLLKTIYSDTVPSGLAYSQNGKYLIAGTGAYPLNTNIYKTTNYSLYSSFKKYTNVTKAVGFLQRGSTTLAVSGGGDNNEIYIWDFWKNSTKVLQKIVGVGESVWSVGIKEDSVAWGNSGRNIHDDNSWNIQKSINLKTFKIQNSSLNSNSFNRISTTSGNYSLSHSKGGEYGKSDAVLNIEKNGNIIAKIVKDATNGLENRCYGWYQKDGKRYIISGGANGHLRIYNIEGREVASLIGHIGEILSIAVDGDRLVSGSSDQTIKVWDLSKLKIDNKKLKIDEEYLSVIMKAMHWSRKKVIDNAQAIEKVTYRSIYLKPLNSNTLKMIMNVRKISEKEAKIYLLKNSKIIREKANLPIYKEIKLYPTLNIFISKNNEYVAWTKEGFFTASKGGAKYIGYHINQGADKEARFVSVDKLYDTFYRPDLIQKALNGEDLSKYAKNISIEKLLQSGLAPEVAIKTHQKSSKKRDINLNLEVCTIDNGGYNNLTLYLNGMAVDVMGGERGLKLKHRSRVRKECFTFDKLISLQNGKNIIGFKATNRAGNIESNLVPHHS